MVDISHCCTQLVREDIQYSSFDTKIVKISQLLELKGTFL